MRTPLVSGRKALETEKETRYVGTHVPQAQWSALGAIAARCGTSRAALVREMIAGATEGELANTKRRAK